MWMHKDRRHHTGAAGSCMSRTIKLDYLKSRMVKDAMDQDSDPVTLDTTHANDKGDGVSSSFIHDASLEGEPAEKTDIPPVYPPSSAAASTDAALKVDESHGPEQSGASDAIGTPMRVSGEARMSAPVIVAAERTDQGEGQQGISDHVAATASSSANASQSVKTSGRTASKSGRGFGLLETLAFLIGLGIFLYPLLAAYVNYSENSAAVDNYDQIVAALSPAQRRAMWHDAKQYDDELGKPTLRDPFKYAEVKEPLGRYYKILNVDGKGMMAYVDIPKINVKLPVRHGTSDEVLRDGTGHIATTHVPTDNRTIHAVITGHTGEVGYMLFDNLTQLRKGDVFQIRVLTRHMSYKVDQIKVIKPTDVSALQPVQNSNYVTLLTCYPYGINSHRLIVRGHYIGDDVPPTRPKGAPLYMVWVLLALFAACLLGWYLLSRRRRNCRRDLEQMEHLGSRATAPGSAGEPLAAIMVSHEYETRSAATRRRRLIKTRKTCSALMWLLALLALFFAWGSVGMMMRISLLPVFDLGYHWFDTHLLYFFGITKY